MSVNRKCNIGLKGFLPKVQNCPVGTGEVDIESYFKLVNQLNIGGPISLHFPYNFIEKREQFSHKEILAKTHNFMKN